MKKYFSLRFYLDTLLRLRTSIIVLGVIYSAISVLSNIGHFIYYIDIILAGKRPDIVSSLGLTDINSGMAMFVAVVVPIMTIAAFSFLMKRNESDFYQAIPVRKEAMLVSGVLAVITASALVLTVSSIVGIAVISPCIGKTVTYDFLRGFVESIGLLLGAALSSVAAAIAVSITGTFVSAFFADVAVLYIPRMVLAIINNSVKALCPALVSGHIIPLFDNNYNILSALLLGNDGVLFKPWAYLYTAVLAVLYLSVALYLFKKRKSEFATHSFTSKPARHYVAISFALYVAMSGVLLLCLDFWLIALALVVFAASVGLYFAYELVTGRREKSLVSTFKAFPIFVGIVGILVAVTLISSLAFKEYKPKAEQIKSVSISTEIDNGLMSMLSYNDYVNLRSENVELTDIITRKIVAEALTRDITDSKYRDYNTVTLKIDTGLTSYRTVCLTEEEHYNLITLLAENDEYKKLWMNVSEGAISPIVYDIVNIEGEGALRILQAMEEEIAEIGFDDWYRIYNDSYGIYDVGISYSVLYDNDLYNINLGIDEELSKTYQIYIEERDKAFAESFSELKKVLTDASLGEGEDMNLSLTLFTDSYYEIYTEISDNKESREIVNRLFELVSSEGFDLDDDVITISVNAHGDGVTSENYYIDLMLPKEKLDQAIQFFEKYGSKF